MVVHSRAKRSRAAEGEVHLGSAMACILFTNEGGAGSMVLCPHIFSPAKLGGFALRNIRTTSGMTAKCFMFLLAFAVPLLVCNFGPQAAGPSFVYDSLRRLVTVYDASGNAAVYKYDAVGNLLSITNSSSTTFVALELSSTSGLAGSTVTIYGTGFCPKPTWAFNGGGG